MENYKHKTTVLGALMVAGGVVKSIYVLVMFGLGLIFGRDAISKLT